METELKIDIDKIRAVLFGVAIGDALGVPVEFNRREEVRQNPVTDMIGYGTYNLPAGTFSDDASLTFCLAEALTQDFDLQAIGNNFVKWYTENFWTARGYVFDVGRTTQIAINNLISGAKPELAGGFDIRANGNGSLMRILPLVFYLSDKPVIERFEITRNVSSITHGHIYSVIACFFYLEFARQLIEGKDKFEIYQNLKTSIPEFLESISINSSETTVFDRLLKGNIYEFPENDILSDGYVLNTLEASIWCLLTTGSYKEAVLEAVNLGYDTDTTGAITGGLAALLYGIENIPQNWIEQIAKYVEIEDLAERIAAKLNEK